MNHTLKPSSLKILQNLLIREARDVLVINYHGDLQLFEQQFLKPAAEIIEKINKKYCHNNTVSTNELIV
jgi:hypothetical protein